MPLDTKKNKKVSVVDFFYKTKYTSNTCSGIVALHTDLIGRIGCLHCKMNGVEIKMDIDDTYNPTFIILRKQYCQPCWLTKVKTR
jgi:hypothetical protein